MINSTALNVNPSNPPDHHGEHGDLELRPGEIAVGVIIGRVGEFFDFFVFGIATVLVFPALFFPFATPTEGLYYAFMIFALGFFGRLLGAWLFRIIYDRFGRATKLTSALFLLGTSTVAIAFLPGYAEIGAAAIVLLTALRVAQGIAVGGAWDGLPSLLATNAPAHRRGWYAMLAQIGAPLGFLVATGLFAYLSTSVNAQDFVDWGWRFAFFTAFAINVVTLFARLRMAVTPEYEELFQASELTPSPLPELFRLKAADIVLGAIAPLASYALFHLVTIFPLAWVILDPDQFDLADVYALQILGAFICLGTMLVSGMVADRIGRPKTLWWGAVLIALFCLPAPFMGNTVIGALLFIPAGFALLGFSQAQSAGAINDCFEPRYRYSGALVTHELSWLLGAAFAPLLALVLSEHLGNAGVALYLLSATLASLLALQLTFRRKAAQNRANAGE